MKEYSKEKIIYEQREVHGERRKAEIIHKAMPDMSAKVGINGMIVNKTESSQDPYGRGGWAQVASEEEQRARKEDAMPDLGLPSKREKIQPVGFQIYIYLVHDIEIRGLYHLQTRKGLLYLRDKTTTKFRSYWEYTFC